MTQQTFDVDGLRCGGCADTVRKTLLELDGVHAVDVTLRDGNSSKVCVEADRHLDVDDVQRSLVARGDFRVLR